MCAQEALDQLGLAGVTFVPTGQAPHREIDPEPGAGVRLRMCEAAVQGDSRFDVSRIEIDRGGPSFTVDTLRALEGRELVVILGGDQAAALPAWREPDEILRLATVAVAEREDFDRERIRMAFVGLSGSDEIVHFGMPRVDISSTLVRRRAAEGKPIRYLVPDAVAEIVEAELLYPESAAVGGE